MSTTALSATRIRSVAHTAKGRLSSALATHSVDLLRVSLGVVFLAFGALSSFPG